MYVADVSTLPGEVDDRETAVSEQQGKVDKCNCVSVLPVRCIKCCQLFILYILSNWHKRRLKKCP